MAGNPNLKTAAMQAGLSPKENDQIDGLSKLIDSHQKLMAMPQEQARQAAATQTPEQQKAHAALFGGANPLGDAFHYLTSAAKTVIATPFKVLNEVSDFATRLYRTGAIAVDQNVDLATAFKTANDKGDKVFSPGRIAAAEAKYGKDMMSVAVKIAGGTQLSDIIANGTDQEKAIASTAAQLRESGQTDHLLQDALDAAQAAKYSPGRQLANLLLPDSMEGSGFLYKGISGVVDASYRIFADPTLQLGKAKKAYDAGNWLLFNIMGKEKYTYGRNLIATVNNDVRVDQVFTNPKISGFFNAYGAELDNLAKARKLRDPAAAAEATTNLKRLAPEFGPSAVDEFISAGVKDAATASNYLKNVSDTSFIFRGQAARKTPLIPVLDASRKARVNLLTAADKVFNIDKVGRALVDNMYGLNATVEDVVTGLTTKAEEIGKAEKSLTNFKQDGAFRFTNQQISARIDRFAQKFAITPYFKNDFFDVNEPNAADKIYQLARLGNSRYHSKIIQEAFAAGNEGQKKQIFDGLFGTIGEIRGWNKSDAGLKTLTESAGRKEQYSPTLFRDVKNADGTITKEPYSPSDFDGEQLAVLDWQLSSGTRVPNIMQLDSLVAKDALTARIFGPNYKRWADKATSYWVFGTLAGPRFVLRNAAEDLLVHALVGESQLGVVSGRSFIRRLAASDPDAKTTFINRLVNKAEQKAAQSQVAKAIVGKDNGAIQNVMLKGIVKDLFAGRIDDASAARLMEHFEFSNKDAFFDSVAEGAKNAQRGASQYMNVTQDVSKFGSQMGALKIDENLYKKANGTSFGNLNPVASQENRVSWMFTITANANSELGKIAIKNLDPRVSRESAIKAIRDYLDKLPEKDLKRFSLYSKGETTQTHAAAIYDSVRPYFSKRNGELNTDLLNKVRKIDEKGNVVVDAKDLSIHDIPGINNIDMAPEFISGPTLVPVTGDNFASGLMQWGWDTMGAANARLSRHPLAVETLNQTLKTMDESGFRKAYIEKTTAGITDPERLLIAEANAKRSLAAMAEDLAHNKVLAYVDNPEVRTQLAMNVRNFARFYRATEDFYRRVVRSVRYNPESLARASLTYEGIAHSGWVQTDENGDQYFFYPGLSPVYKVMAKLGPIFGLKDTFKTGLPVQFGAKLKMMTPSMNPDSLFPTFSGPLAALPIQMVGNIIPQVKDLEQYLTGNMGQDQPLINAVLPAHVNRLLQTLNQDERNSQSASAMRKAATYLEASGHGLKPKIDEMGNEIPPSPAEISAYQDKLQASTMTVMALRFISGFFLPASPSVNLKSDMAKWVRDNGEVSYKATFNKLIEKNNGNIDKAVGDWIKYFPDQMPYTVSESESTVVANVRAVDSANQWVKDNQAVLDKYKEAGAFLIPQAGKFDFNSYKLLFKEGIKANKSVSDFVRQVSVAKDREIYYQKKNEYDQMLLSAVGTDAKRQIRNDWQTWSDQFKGVRPLLQEELGKGSATAIQRTVALSDLRNLLNDKSITTEPKTQSILRDMLSQYDNYVLARDYAATPGSGADQNYKDMLKTSAQESLKSLAENNPNAMAAFNSLFAPLFR
jgi:hypothetical protein